MSEIRDDFMVTRARKKLWEIELNLLEKIETVCEREGLNYFLIGGAAIGAVRHKGFIPWDDDMDIGMLRHDFEKLVYSLVNQGIEGCVVQYGFTDASEKSTFLRIRDLNSTAIIRSQINKERCSHGVFIEIYPFDKVPKLKVQRAAQRILSSLYKTELDFRFDGRPLVGKNKVFHIFLRKYCTEILWKKWNRICQRYNNSELEYVDTPALPLYAKTGIHLYAIKDVMTSIKVPYENSIVRVAAGNDHCLRIHFGDYMKLPPIEQRGVRHNSVVFYDPDIPFTEYRDMSIPKRYFDGEYGLSPI